MKVLAWVEVAYCRAGGLSTASVCHIEGYTSAFVESFSGEYWPLGDLSVVLCRGYNPAFVVRGDEGGGGGGKEMEVSITPPLVPPSLLPLTPSFPSFPQPLE